MVILLELTCPAEEGISAAQLRKETRYAELLRLINEQKVWKAQLLTLEVGARGLVCSKTFHAFRRLGLSAPQAKTLVKSLSEVAVRCSYAIYLAHSSPIWSHNDDLVLSHSLPEPQKTPPPIPNGRQANLPSIRKSGPLSAPSS